MKAKLLTLSFLVISMGLVRAQVFSNRQVGEKNERDIDSVKMAQYPYALPILGDKAAGLGFELPYSAGLSVQYFWQESDLIIENMNVGFNGSPMVNVDEFVRFDVSKAQASSITVRPDIWLFPFLNLYGILGRSQASTEIGFGVYLPDGGNGYSEALSASTLVEFNATTFGLGMTPTVGVGGGFMALDMNVAWTDVPQLNKPAKTFVFGPRFGKKFDLKNPNQNVVLWVGGFRVHLSGETEGSIALGEVFDTEGWGGSVDEGIQKVENAQSSVENWWNGLTPAQQNNPINQAKYNKANQVLDAAGEFLVAADGALGTVANSTVQYAMHKRPADMWNFIVGGQYQLNKHLMFRAEYGFLGSRDQFIGGVQYRFGL